MTKFVLHGGMAHVPDSRNDLFFQEILKDTPENLKILLVVFSKEPDKVFKNVDEDKAQLTGP